jgi:hypothetical protein
MENANVEMKWDVVELEDGTLICAETGTWLLPPVGSEVEAEFGLN